MGIVELIYPVLFDLISPSKDFWHKKIMSFLFLSLSLSLSLSLTHFSLLWEWLGFLYLEFQKIEKKKRRLKS